MSTPPKGDPALGWLFVEELRADGIDPDNIPTPEEILAGARRRAARGAVDPPRGAPLPANVVPLQARRSRRLFWLAAAAFLLVAGGAAFAERDAIVALFRKPPPPETPEMVAGHLIDEATEVCATKFYGICARKTDAAAKLLPAGEDDPRVKALRETIRASTHYEPLHDKDMGWDGAGRGGGGRERGASLR